MQTVARSNFTTVKTEGAILPADLLQRVADGQLAGLLPQDYHLAPGEKLNEAINRAWNRCLGVWQAFNPQRQNLSATDSGVTLTRERWLLILLQELGYGRLPYHGRLGIGGSDLGVRDGGAANSQAPNSQSLTPDSYPISHVWEQTPIHLVSFRQELDRRDPASKRSPHSLVQEFLNRSEAHLWGIVSNGLVLRLLRDNVSLTRAAYLEFDLEMMLTGELYADFSLLWLVCHQSRVEGLGSRGEEEQGSAGASPADCWLERWSQAAAEQGTRALDALRDGVQEAISALGRGFLAHPANGELRRQLHSGELSTQDYYRQLLRLVYRLIFLFVAEDRDLLVALPPTEQESAGAGSAGEKLSPAPGSAAPLPEIRQRYLQYYSLTRLRGMAESRRGGPHPDLYRTQRRVFELLREGYPPLGLPALGSFLFSGRATPALDGADLANIDLLTAIRALAFTSEGRVRRPVDYKNLKAEEWGSVYESLLELHPRLNIAAAGFELATAAGSERKTTGSYYTPSSLINSLLDTALEPVVTDRLLGSTGAGSGGEKISPAPGSPAPHLSTVETQEQAILSIKVVDPACGSGAFLIAAANRLALHLSRVRTGDDEPGPAARREALREVVRHCIHGVDINEMSVELCKVALWLETLDPGKPLTFLDANIQCGNSLLGATPALLAEGIPDEAFTPITGDDKGYCREWKAQNKKQRGQRVMALTPQPWERLGDLAAAMAGLEQLGDGSLAEVRAQESGYEQLVRSSAYEYSQLWADAWCAAFMWRKQPEYAGGFAYPITEAVFREIEKNPFNVAPWMRQEIERLRGEYQFFHWHLAFPQVFGVPPAGEGADNEQTGWNGGFDVVLGNPPWERIKLQEKEWFAARDPEIATAPNAAARRRKIEALAKENPTLLADFEANKRKAEGDSAFVRNSGRYPLCGRGDVNTYPIFAELSRYIQSDSGRVGIIVPLGIATDFTYQDFFADVMDSGALVSLYDFENREHIFPGVHRNYNFALMTLTGVAHSQSEADFAFFMGQVADLRDPQRRFTLTPTDLKLINPNTRTCPIFNSRRDADLTKTIYRRAPVLVKEGPPEVNPWGVKLTVMLHMSGDSNLFRTQEQLAGDGWQLSGSSFSKNGEVYLPLYEAKMMHQFEPRHATYAGQTEADLQKGFCRDLSPAEYTDPAALALPRYWVPAPEVKQRMREQFGDYRWLIGFRDVTRAVDKRTAQFAVLPLVGVGHKIPLIFLTAATMPQTIGFLANINAFALDYVARQKIGGISMSYFIVKQLPVLPPDTYAQPCKWGIGNREVGNRENPTPYSPFPISLWLLPRVLELTYTAWDLQPFARDCGYLGAPFRWDEARRFLLRCELDAAFFHLYGIAREDVAYIMETFPIVRRKDEAAHGEFRTQRVILEIYDEMQQAIASGRPYQTRLDPPPADSRVAHPWDTAYGEAPEPGREWQPVERMKDDPLAGDRGGRLKGKAPEPRTPDSEPLILQNPVADMTPPKKAKPTTVAQGSLIEVLPPPGGPRTVRLKRAMALGSDPSPLATRELVAFLADEDSNIRWLAGSTLVQRPTADAVAALAAFLSQAEPGRVSAALPEARRVLALIADTAAEDSVRQAAGAVLGEMGE